MVRETGHCVDRLISVVTVVQRRISQVTLEKERPISVVTVVQRRISQGTLEKE